MVGSGQSRQHQSGGGLRKEPHIAIDTDLVGGGRCPAQFQMRMFASFLIGVTVPNGSAVQVDVVMVVGTFSEVVVIKGSYDRQNQREQGGRQQQHPAQRGRFVYPGSGGRASEFVPRRAWFGRHY